MFSPIIEYFNRDDERFIPNLYKSDQRNKHLASLERWRSSYGFLFLIFGLLAVIEVFIGNLLPSTILLLIGTAVVYLDSDMRIKMIKLIQANHAAANPNLKSSGTS
jgi:hypothetical protein